MIESWLAELGVLARCVAAIGMAVEGREGTYEVCFSVGGPAQLHEPLIRVLITRPGIQRLTHGL